MGFHFCIYKTRLNTGLRSRLRSGLKTIFHHSAHLGFFWKLLFSTFAISIHKKQYYRPKVKPCGTPGWIIAQSDAWPLRITLWILPLKKLVIQWKKFPQTPFCFNLNNNPSCQTLSQVLHISRNTPWVSRVRMQSKVEKVSWVIASSW